jgi:hypothetical protein
MAEYSIIFDRNQYQKAKVMKVFWDANGPCATDDKTRIFARKLAMRTAFSAERKQKTCHPLLWNYYSFNSASEA